MQHRFDRIRGLIHRKHQCDFAELQCEIDELEAEVQALTECPCHCGQTDNHPATGTITATREDGTVADTFAPGATIYLTAGQFTNAEGVAITGTVPGTWSSNQGTITANPNNADEATLVNVPIGAFSVAFVTQSGLTLGYDAAVVDQTPTAGTITGSTTPPSDEPAPAAPSTPAA